jgi:hypothetical protein
MSREAMQKALTALRISTPFAHALEYYEFRNKAIKDIEAELAKPEQEPVAWMVRDQVDGCRYPSALKNPAGSINGESKPLYAAPLRKEWVGLTEHEIWECQKPGLSDDVYKLIEAKLKELNT